MDSFSVRGFNGFLEVEIDKIFGFPDQTSHFGGYDTESRVKVESNGFSVDSKLWLSTGEVFDLYNSLREAHEKLNGSAKFESSERNLSFAINYELLGRVSIQGEFRDNKLEDNFLRFEISSDQSYLNRTLVELTQFVRKYGDNSGKKSI
ncbi:hypothetical protein [Hymenobacter psoromatis]|uniref:WapI family immunity protein n=2 Tax=Hymenobacter psoromatis TaxID=1484116 RepID=UPI001CBBB625|nr:hypothetical protein [Hymenobacter psoromatis]